MYGKDKKYMYFFMWVAVYFLVLIRIKLRLSIILYRHVSKLNIMES